MPRPTSSEYSPYFGKYIHLAEGEDARQVVENSFHQLQEFLATLPAERAHFSYAEGKWTLSQLLQHMIDTERVFAYRAMAISRGEKQPLPGFDENEYAANAKAENRTLTDLANEMLLVRQTTLILYRNMSEEGLFRMGTASNHPVNANSLAFILAGHVVHHENIIRERYL